MEDVPPLLHQVIPERADFLLRDHQISPDSSVIIKVYLKFCMANGRLTLGYCKLHSEVGCLHMFVGEQ